MTAKQLEQYFRDILKDRGSKALYSIQVFLEHSKPQYRKSATKSLVQFPWKSVESLLIRMVEDTSKIVQKEAIRSLSHFEEGKEYLQQHLLSFGQELQLYIQDTMTISQYRPTGVLQVNEFVTSLNRQIGEITYEIEGEISAYQTSTFGANQWVFFDLKDTSKEGKVRCFSTLFQIRKSRISPIDGMKVIVKGRARLSAKSGIFSLNVEEIRISGEGERARALELLKHKLSSEGLFQESRKRQIPYLPQTIGLITSQDAAAYQDFMKVLSHRMGGLNILFRHAQVQGERAVESIIQAIELLNSYPDIEVIVITRGGGAMDDLHAFNDEAVVRAVFNSTKPIISAVGHERDVTLIDYVSDKRASTPSNAAELLVPQRFDLVHRVEGIESRMQSFLTQEMYQYMNIVRYHEQIMVRYYQSIQQRFERLIYGLAQQKLNIHQHLVTLQHHIGSTQEQLLRLIHSEVQSHKVRIAYIERILSGYNPDMILKQGYSITKIHGKIIASIQDIHDQDILETQLRDGTVQSVVYKKKSSL